MKKREKDSVIRMIQKSFDNQCFSFLRWSVNLKEPQKIQKEPMRDALHEKWFEPCKTQFEAEVTAKTYLLTWLSTSENLGKCTIYLYSAFYSSFFALLSKLLFHHKEWKCTFNVPLLTWHYVIGTVTLSSMFVSTGQAISSSVDWNC